MKSRKERTILKVVVRTWGDGLGVRIPAAFIEALDLHDGSLVEVSLQAGGLLITKSRQEQLEELLDRITLQNMHGENFFGAIGKEA
jgi:antitoxin MazE